MKNARDTPSASERPTMQQMTKNEVKRLIEKCARKLTLDDVDLIMKLDAAAEKVVNPVPSKLRLFDFPVVVAGYRFHTPTLGKDIYWREVVSGAVDDELSGAAFFWLLTFEDTPTFASDDVLREVCRWAKHCSLTEADIKYLEKLYVSDNGGSSGDYGDIIALLVREYGQTVEHWLNAPESEITMLVNDFTKRQEAAAAEMRKTKNGRAVAPSPSPKIRALAEFSRIKAEIERIWNG
jgi:hypothetical protein